MPATLDRLGEAGARLVIIEMPPALTDAIRSVMRYADFVLVPTQDGITDLKAIGRTVQLSANWIVRMRGDVPLRVEIRSTGVTG
jgi:chromosome partitioning protein